MGVVLMAGLRFEGNTSGNVAEVDVNNRVLVRLPDASTPASVGGIRMFSENDAGAVSGTPYLVSPETDDDYRLRVAHECLFDTETFNYTAQNTGKHIYRNTTMTFGWTAAGLTTNSGNITTTTTGGSFATYAEFPLIGTTQLYAEIIGSFTASPTTNTIVDIGPFRPGAANPFAPTDGVYFRLTAAGLSGVINFNGTETTTAPFGLSYTLNRKYQFVIAVHERDCEFWIDGVLYGTIVTPNGQGQPCMSAALPFAVRHAITGGAAGAALSFQLNDYSISLGGPNIAMTASIMGQRIYGSYQGLSGGTMGSLATYPNSTNPTAAAPSNTALTANLPAGLGGQGLVTAAAAAATDGIWGSYQVPAGTVNVQGRRLVIRGVRLDLVNLGAAVATTATTIQFSLAFGHTAVSLATAETATTKAPRRVPVGIATWPVGAAIGAGPQSAIVPLDLGDAPVFVNPGEFVQLVGKFIVGTATASQTISFVWQPVYGWE
jgi:hypothetical protein